LSFFFFQDIRSPLQLAMDKLIRVRQLGDIKGTSTKEERRISAKKCADQDSTSSESEKQVTSWAITSLKAFNNSLSIIIFIYGIWVILLFSLIYFIELF